MVLGDIFAAASLAQSVFSKKADRIETAQLVVRYWGLLLFELNGNYRTCKVVWDFAHTQPNEPRLPSLSFDVSAVVLPELARLAPLPRAISMAQRLITKLKETEAFAAMAAQQASSQPAGSPTVKSMRWCASYFTHAEAAKRFNALREMAADGGRKAHGDAWQQLEAEMLPDPMTIPVPDQGLEGLANAEDSRT